MSDRPVIHYFQGCFLLHAAGSQIRARTVFEKLVGHFSNLTHYSFRNHASWAWTDDHVAQFKALYPQVKLVLEETTGVARKLTSAKNLALSVIPSQGRATLDFSVPGISGCWRALLNAQPQAIIFVNFVDGLTQLNGLGGRAIFIDTHDVKFVHHMRLHRERASTLGVVRKFRGECASLENAAGLIAISPTEASYFRLVTPNVPVFYAPMPPAANYIEPTASEFDLLFVGSGFALNVDGLADFLLRNAEWLAPYRIAVCGSVCADPKIVTAAQAHGNIQLLGYVDNLANLYGRSKIALSPVEGTGLKIKIVDALRHGLPVAASGSSLQGLPPGYRDAVIPLDRAAIESLLTDDHALMRARNAVRTYYDGFDTLSEWDALIESMMATSAGL